MMAWVRSVVPVMRQEICGGGAGFEAAEGKVQAREVFGEADGGGVCDAAAGLHGGAEMQDTAQEGAGGEDGGGAGIGVSRRGLDAGEAIA